MTRSLVSIIVPTYNGARWLREALASAVAQTYDSVEIVVCDDQSSDASYGLASEIAQGIASIRVYRNDHRLGLSGNWNRAMYLARGSYIKFLFQDDTLTPGCVQQMVELAEKAPTVGLVFSRRHIHTEDGGSIRAERQAQSNLQAGMQFATVIPGKELLRKIAEMRVSRNIIGEPSCVLIRKEAVDGQFDPRLRQAVDLDMWIRILASWDAGYIPEALATFRIHTGSESARNDRRLVYAVDRLWLTESLIGSLGSTDRRTQLTLRARALVRVVSELAISVVRHPTLMPYGLRNLWHYLLSGWR